MSRGKSVVQTEMIVLFGLCACLVAVGTGSHVMMLGACVAGLVTLVRVLASRSTAPGGWDDATAHRYGPPDPRPQLAGGRCDHCKQKIMTELEAALCKKCNVPLHRECRRDHRAETHRPRSGQVYR